MISPEKLKSFIHSKLSGTFTKNLSWLGASQGLIRVSRLSATVILPRFLSAEEYGLAALVLTIFEFIQTFSRDGVHSRVIQATEEELEDISNSAYWLCWTTYLGLFFIQCLLAFPIARFYGDDRLIVPICVLALSYLITPLGRIQFALIQRENNFKLIAFAQTLRYATANILTAIFAFMGMGMWAIVLPILLTTPLEFVFYLVRCPWRRTSGFTTKNWGNIFKFGVNILGIQVSKTLRDNLDYLIVGRFIGIQELGFYYFAFNAGMGISLTIVNSVATAIYPHLCSVRDDFKTLKYEFTKSLKTIAYIIIPFVMLQSLLAPIYVPIVFGEQWVPAVPILILICLSAIPRPFDAAAYSLLVAIGKPHLALRWNIFFTILLSITLLVGTKWGVMGVALAVFGAHVLLIPLFVKWTYDYVFLKNKGNLITT